MFVLILLKTFGYVVTDKREEAMEKAYRQVT